jgi:hypothetical protein
MAGIFQRGVYSMGFDMAPTISQVFTLGTGGSPSTTTAFGFGFSWSTGGFSGISFNTNLTKLVMGMRVNLAVLSSSNPFFAFYDTTAGAEQLNLRVFPDGHLQFCSGNTTTAIGPASVAGLIQPTTWVYVEVSIIMSATVGFVECRLNGNPTPVISSAATLNTVPTGNVWVSGLFVQSNTGATCFFDDWYMLDTTAASPLNTYLGNVQVRGDKPNANSAVGGRNAYTPTNPTNVNNTNVGNIPINTAEFNSDATAGDYDMFRFPSLSATSVLFLNEWVQLELDAAGARTVALNTYSNGTDDLGTAFTPSAGTYQLINLAEIVDPHTGSAWTVANAGAVEMGLKTVT